MTTKPIERCIAYFKSVILERFENIDCWVAGGAVRDFFSKGYCSSDVDVFFLNRVEYDKAAKLLDTSQGSLLRLVFSNSSTVVYMVGKYKIQLVGAHFFPTPAATIDAFDFTVCCAAVDQEQLYCNDTFFMDLAGKKLVINRLPYPLSTMQRMQRYIKRGYTICNGGLLEIARAVQLVDLNNPNENALEFYPDGTPRFMRID